MPVTRLTRNKMRNTTNKTCAIDAAVLASPKKPRAPAISATIRNVSAQPNMIHLLRFGVCSDQSFQTQWPELLIREATHQDENQYNHQHESKTAAGAISPISAVGPRRRGA